VFCKDFFYKKRRERKKQNEKDGVVQELPKKISIIIIPILVYIFGCVVCRGCNYCSLKKRK
jgi:hypothetical protein